MIERRLSRVLAVCLLAASLLAADKPSPEHQKWLEDVSPIITRIERDVFVKLRTDVERDKFIRFFWKARDSSPDTSENEFQREYMERIRFADQNFGHYSPKRGSQTERGFYYLLLGPPLERQFYTTHSEIWPLELWFYKGAEEFGLPGYFYLIFYQPEGLGDYRLYYPGVEGPGKLVVALQQGRALNASKAVQTIRKINSELASAAVSYLPGERPMGAGSMSSDNIIASIRQIPEKKFSDSYARSYMTYKDLVETEYFDNYLASASQVKVLVESGQPFLHWAIEPEKMNFASRGNVAYASFEFVLRLEDLQGRLVFENAEEIPVRLTFEQYKAHERQRFAFQDLLAVAPGEYRALFLLKNKTGRDFSSFEARVSVPEKREARLSQPLLFHSRDAVPEAQKANLKAFALGGFQYYVGARNEFLPSEKLGVLVQGLDVGRGPAGESASFVVELLSLDSGKSVGTFPLGETESGVFGPQTLAALGSFPLSGVPPGYYSAEVSALEPDGRKLLTQRENFIVLSQAFPVIPWVYARLRGPFPGVDHLRTLGTQFFLKGEFDRARGAFEQALGIRDDPGLRLLLAKALYGLGRYKESLGQALPLYERAPDRETAKVIALDHAALKDWPSALAYLGKLLSEATEISVLNLAAECHLAMGKPDLALPLLQKSLALLPDQPSIRELEAKTRMQLKE